MPSLGELQAQRAEKFKKSTSDGAKTYQRLYKDAERSAATSKKAGNNSGAAVSFASAAVYRSTTNSSHYGGGDAGHREAVGVNVRASQRQTRIVDQQRRHAASKSSSSKK